MAKSKSKRGSGRGSSKRTGARPVRGSRPATRRAPQKKPLARPLTRSEVDRALRSQLAKQATQATKSKSLEPKLVAALERAQTEAARVGFASTLKIVRPPQRPVRAGSWTTPWAIVARFTWRDVVGYDELHAILDAWGGGRVTKTNGEINKQRYARIKITYVDKGNREEYTLAESAPWALCLSRAEGECDPTDTETVRAHGYIGSLASRYGLVRDSNGNLIKGTIIRHVYVWLSSDMSRNIMR